MGKVAYDLAFGSQSSYVYGVDAYDSTKVGIGKTINQNTGATYDSNYVAPFPMAFARPVETGGAVPAQNCGAINWSTTYNWVFFADQAAAAATRRIQMYVHNKLTGEMTWQGFITCAYPFAGTQNVYIQIGILPIYDKYTTGTASVSGTAVTGTDTTWQTSTIPAGCRIGFGTTDPSAVTRWYEIASVGSNTTITLTESASIGNGSYVIEDLRMAQIVTNALTATNGGLFLAKGLRFEMFNAGGPTVAAAVSTDNVRANYWLADAVTSTNTASIGLDIIKTDLSTQHIYVLNTVANPILFKYNIRAALTVATGRSTSAFVLVSGAYGALTGAPVQANNFCIATTSHGAGAGKPCGYFSTATRWYRTKNVTTITSLDTVWASGVCLEVPPGSSTTFAATGSMRSSNYIAQIDRFVICTGGRAYLTRFKDDSSPFDRIFLIGDTQILQMTADNVNTAPHPSYVIGAFFSGTVSEATATNAFLYLATSGLTAITNFVYALPIGSDWDSTDADGSWTGSKQCLVTPEILTANTDSYIRAYVNWTSIIGSTSLSTRNLGSPSEPVKLSCRTSGISDDSGIWTTCNNVNDLSNIDPASSIQFRLEWKVAGTTCIPAKVSAMGVIYNDLSTDVHYQPSIGQSSIANKQFGWRFSAAFGTTVPRLKIRLYDAVVGTLLLTDDSTTQNGVWEESTNGGSSYAAWSNTDKGNETTYLRFTPVSLGDNLRVRALLTLY